MKKKRITINNYYDIDSDQFISVKLYFSPEIYEDIMTKKMLW